MGYLKKIISSDSLTDIAYQPVVNSDSLELISNGALVHMFEFRTYINEPRDDPNYIKNLADAFAGTASGSYSEYRNNIFFNEGKNYLELLPTSAIRKDYPLQLFDEKTNVGIVLKPENTQIQLLQPNDTYSEIDSGYFACQCRNMFNDRILHNANFGSEVNQYSGFVEFKLKNEAESNKLHDLFRNHFWDLFSKGAEPGTAEFSTNIKSAVSRSSEITNDLDKRIMMTEILANVSPKAADSLVIYTNHTSDKINYNCVKADPQNRLEIQGIMLAVLYNELAKSNGGSPLPIIHYHSNLEIDGFNGSVTVSPPTIQEIIPEDKKIAHALSTNVYLKKYFEQQLGSERVNNMLASERHKF